MKRVFIFLLVVLFSFSLFSGSVMAAEMNLKIGIMPAVDSAPILLAQEKGYFAEAGLDLKVDIYTNAVNRQTALQTNTIDGAMTDLIAFVNNVNNGFPVKITTSTDGSFPILVSKNFQEKKEVRIGLMEVSVSNFLSEQFLSSDYILNKTFIPAIPARLEMVKSGQLEMAVIPEPLASTAELQGLEKRIYKNKYDFMPEAMIFTETALKEKAPALKVFHEVYNKAVREIKQDDTEAREVLIASLGLPAEIKDLITMPEYNLTRVPSQEYLNVVINWIEKTNDSQINIDYQKVVERKYTVQ